MDQFFAHPLVPGAQNEEVDARRDDESVRSVGDLPVQTSDYRKSCGCGGGAKRRKATIRPVSGGERNRITTSSLFELPATVRPAGRTFDAGSIRRAWEFHYTGRLSSCQSSNRLWAHTKAPFTHPIGLVFAPHETAGSRRSRPSASHANRFLGVSISRSTRRRDG